MYYSDIQIVLQEVPGEISICFSICGCKLRCEGCHSPILWKEGNGRQLTRDVYENTLTTYKGLANCVLFMGGEWHQTELLGYLDFARLEGYKTCLYSGEECVDDAILERLDWVKTGKWITELGGLDSPRTNQKFIEVRSNKLLNHLFLKNH
ncbi:anaerobic ribonucleoside-triphosphate reductase activating protein [Maribacter sp. ANRC-HE7]|uniref:Anaerobic ribonucleoside-triphosphate reductase activating protein n=1 Tax=Maribacter aquimaris TaxID=2737171 RepID=A0ABR7V1E2_9FLAO|nr:anaerobic ribonucleoside-triphosphate reductase activating protein [Maribacter aquimaris]MBD0776972.1 anaerobic ribonucleoside-triphosphate reductase activating protein [Maribacter aquimaris]